MRNLIIMTALLSLLEPAVAQDLETRRRAAREACWREAGFVGNVQNTRVTAAQGQMIRECIGKRMGGPPPGGGRQRP